MSNNLLSMRKKAICCFSGVLLSAAITLSSALVSNAGAQTLFAQPDTTPNFAAYTYWEECLVATTRIAHEVQTRKDTIWYDTASREVREEKQLRNATQPRPAAAVKAASSCLGDFNPDTVTIHSWGFPVKNIYYLLLLASRDDDAERLIERWMDSVASRSKDYERRARSQILTMHMQEIRPVRMEAARHHYSRILELLKDDTLGRAAGSHFAMSSLAWLVGDTVYSDSLAWLAISIVESHPSADRREVFPSRFLELLAGRLRQLTYQEGLDSIAISTAAYKSWEANAILARIYGEVQKKETDSLDLSKLPSLVGEHYYVASDGNGQGVGNYSKLGALPENTIPVQGRVNLVYALPSYCHAEGHWREVDGLKKRSIGALRCAASYAWLRRIKQRVPELELTLLSYTYGTVGKMEPLKPAEEADTLAKLWLGWHKIPARLVVEETPYFHVADPDKRRVDMPTPYGAILNREVPYPLFQLVDPDGVKINLLTGGIESEANIKFLEAIIRRGRQ